MRFSNFLNKAPMGKRIMHSARALFLTFLALEKSKRNCTFHENCAAAELREGWQKIYSGKIVPQQCNCSGAGAVHPEKSGQDLQRSGNPNSNKLNLFFFYLKNLTYFSTLILEQ